MPVGTHAITAERIGFRSLTQEVTVTAGATVVQDFTIAEEALGLDEIIVTGTPGGTQRRAIGNSVLSVQAADVSASVATQSIQDLMGNRTAGLQFSRVEGSLGTGSAIAIRGNQSFSLASNPLIYVDGIRVNNASDAGPRTNQAEVNVLNDFNPQDIESIEIIKGPAAATLYGTEASAGVIQIITKPGCHGCAAVRRVDTRWDQLHEGPGGKNGHPLWLQGHLQASVPGGRGPHLVQPVRGGETGSSRTGGSPG